MNVIIRTAPIDAAMTANAMVQELVANGDGVKELPERQPKPPTKDHWLAVLHMLIVMMNLTEDTDVLTAAIVMVPELVLGGNGAKEPQDQPTMVETVDHHHITKLKEDHGGEVVPVPTIVTVMVPDIVLGIENVEEPQDTSNQLVTPHVEHVALVQDLIDVPHVTLEDS